MDVHWTNTAKGHLAGIHAHIAQDSPEYAKRVVDILTSRSKQIGHYPGSGRMVPEYEHEQIREVIEGSYRIIYHIKSSQIDVLAVIHVARNALRKKETGDIQGINEK